MSPRDGGVAARTLTDPGVVKVITKMLRDQGVPAWDIEDARQDVYAKALEAIRRGRAPAETEELAPLRSSRVQRDPVDAGRQLEVLAQLFREKAMPPDGVDILEGVACRCTWAEIAEPLGISEDLAETRYRRMKDTYRRRMTKLGLLPGMLPLRLIVSEARAISRLRGAA